MRRLATPLAAASLALGLVVAPAAAQDRRAPTVTGQTCSDSGGGVRRCNQQVTSFDGVELNTYLFLPPGASASSQRPVVLRSHGWGGQASRDPAEDATLGRLLDEGWIVLTWDQRGFGGSGGEAEVDSPAYEGRDVALLIDFVARLPEVETESPGDPVLGFTGGSYAGGIQTLAASTDDGPGAPRIDAMAPEITWNDLRYSLYPEAVVKDSWVEALLALSADDRVAPWVHEAAAEVAATGNVPQEVLDRFGFRSYATNYDPALAVDPGHRSEPGDTITVPTLWLQGSPDTLFNLTEVRHNFEDLRARDVPTKLFIFCGGVDGGGRTTHGFCPPDYVDGGDVQKGDDLIVDWLRRHMAGDTTVDTGPAVEWESNLGVFRRERGYPVADGSSPTLTAAGSITTTGAQLEPPDRPAFAAATSDPASPQAIESDDAITATGRAVDILGVPTATVEVMQPFGAPPIPAGTSVHLFLKLVDVEADRVVDHQDAAVRFDDVSGTSQTAEVELPGLAYTLPEGHSLKLQVATESIVHAEARTASVVDVTATVRVPVRPARSERVAGRDRVATAVALSDATRQAAETVVLARSDDYADALAGVPLASALGAPVLLTAGDDLDDRTAREIRRLGASRVILLGGSAALSDAVESQVVAIGGITTQRVAGSNRFGTAAAIAGREELDGARVFLVEGAHPNPDRGWPDAVSVGPLAAREGNPILLATADRLPTETAAALDRLQTGRVTIIGGTSALSERVAADADGHAGSVDRIAGDDRYLTARAIADAAVAGGADPATVVLATGLDYPDALSAGPVAAAFDAPLLLVADSAAADTAPGSFVREHEHRIERVMLSGGIQAIPAGVATAIDRILAAG